MMVTVNQCVEQVEKEQLAELVPGVVEVMKRGVGMATKVAAAQVVTSLVHHNRNELTPYAST